MFSGQLFDEVLHPSVSITPCFIIALTVVWNSACFSHSSVRMKAAGIQWCLFYSPLSAQHLAPYNTLNRFSIISHSSTYWLIQLCLRLGSTGDRFSDGSFLMRAFGNTPVCRAGCRIGQREELNCDIVIRLQPHHSAENPTASLVPIWHKEVDSLYVLCHCRGAVPGKRNDCEPPAFSSQIISWGENSCSNQLPTLPASS